MIKWTVLFALFAAGCAPPARPPSTVFIRVVDEAKQPVPAAEIAAGASVISRTDTAGRAEVTVRGREGEMYPVEVRCPSGYRNPLGSAVAIRKFDPSLPSPEYVSTCARMRHVVDVEIHAEGGPNLPVVHLGREIARTDATGRTKVQIEGDVHERLELTLSTSAPEHAKLHPQNPFATFEIEEHDVVKPFEVKLTKDKPPKKRAAAKPTIQVF